VIAGNDQLRPAVVLVADRTLSADYKVLLEGMVATMQTTRTPEFLMRRLLSRPLAVDGSGRALKAPLGLRRVEASLLAHTPLGSEDVVCTTPEGLERLLGPWVKVVGVSSGDPLGRGMSNTTTAAFQPGELYTRTWTAGMMDGLRRAKREHGFVIVAGGPGAWQWAQDANSCQRCGVDAVFEGYFEDRGPELFMELLAGRSAPKHRRLDGARRLPVQPIRGASCLGAVELSRGCGKGCRFCPVAQMPMEHVSPEVIVADLETNVAAGVRTVVSGSEDFFRYGSTGVRVDFKRLRSLLERMREVKGLSFMQIDHANVSSVVQLDEHELTEVRRLLTWDANPRHLWLNLGVESANGSLVRENGPGKIAPFGADDWEEMVLTAGERLARSGFFPMFSIILGLPGETPEDVARTARLVDKLARFGGVVFPVFHEPIRQGRDEFGVAFRLGRMRRDHFDLFTKCYEINFKRVPVLYSDNLRAGGVSWRKRALLRVLGRLEVVGWKRTFARLDKEIAARDLASGRASVEIAPAAGREDTAQERREVRHAGSRS